MAKEGEEKKVVTAVYKVNLHCPKCAEDIKKPLLRVPGVQSVDTQFEKGEVTVKGTIDEKEIHKRLEKLSKQNVETVDKAKKITKEKVGTTTIKVYLHCSKCEDALRKKLLKQKGVHDVKMDAKAQTVTIQGDVEPEKLLTFMKERVHKHAEIIPPKQEKKEEKKEKKQEKKAKKEEDEDEEEEEMKKKKKEKDVDKNDNRKAYTVQVRGAESRMVFEHKNERQVQGKTPEGLVPYGQVPYGQVPYFVHYVYAPQMFSDENPNACSVM